MNFFDPPLTSNGEDYGPVRFREIVKERYLISKNLNTSYTDTKYITPTERTILLQFLVEDFKNQDQIIQNMSSSLGK